MDVKERLRQLMYERGWTIYKVTKEAGISWSTVHNMFKQNTDPSISTLESICRGMGITLTHFFNEPSQTGLTDEQYFLISRWNRLSDRDW